MKIAKNPKTADFKRKNEKTRENHTKQPINIIE